MRGMHYTYPVGSVWLRWGALAALLWGAASMAGAVERKLSIEAPDSVGAHEDIRVMVLASTDAGMGEQVGFLQVEASSDNGKTWTAMCYLQNMGPRARQEITVKSGQAGTFTQLRARAAFRDGLAGDVDYRGAAILWDRSWGSWATPPAKKATIAVNKP